MSTVVAAAACHHNSAQPDTAAPTQPAPSATQGDQQLNGQYYQQNGQNPQTGAQPTPPTNDMNHAPSSATPESAPSTAPVAPPSNPMPSTNPTTSPNSPPTTTP